MTALLFHIGNHGIGNDECLLRREREAGDEVSGMTEQAISSFSSVTEWSTRVNGGVISTCENFFPLF